MSDGIKITVYRASVGYRSGVFKMLARKVTDKSIWIDGYRCARRAHGTVVFDTFKEAKDWLITEARNRFEQARKAMFEAESVLETAINIDESEIKTSTDRW